ncbi:Trifunctional NAD biosynthesis/regulator protein NadR [Posidoniimonas corsicana]|uniref:Trifunctional NAD biosynthesis/regulator protein NadR n=1 Tax=Posidoniimonas corsicana TaxID=1938618 RepID=A0A5C5VJU4_9BACT|nr:AAA family ATPase [Posidoniimonas corsicana]TWT37982.1 Trifunctional NAD biosynthesis/regulator protein NadR [Posidoniimonas corsicana]
MKTGLTLGKFAPLHKGHQLLIERALDETDRVVVVVYDAPGLATPPLPVRANWVRTLYPSVEVLEAWGGPAEVGDTPKIRRVQEEFLLGILAGREITHFYSSEFYGAHISRALGAVDRRVDEPRAMLPISGTSARADPYASRKFIAPQVYRDLITKVVLLGAPSTGKTTLAARLADDLQTVWMPEYGREYWERHQVNRRLTSDQLLEIAEGHLEREETLVQQANRVLFVDTDATTTRRFSHYYLGASEPRLDRLAAAARSRYDLFFLCGDDIPYDDTWDRSGLANRSTLQRQTRADLIASRIPFIDLTGSLGERASKVRAILSGYDKFDSLANQLWAAKPEL